jgi:glucose-6-phosphate 1-dehydrogenase
VKGIRLIICGATGDLTGRYLLPALSELAEAGSLPDQLEVIGVAHEPWDSARFAHHVAEQLSLHAPAITEAARRAVISRCQYAAADVTDPSALTAAVRGSPGPVVAYLALPPSLFAPAVCALSETGLPAGSRVVVEKPFGTGLGSARSLNSLLGARFPETAVFRMDHFLGHQTVQNVLGVRFANRIFEPVWNRHHIERVDVVWEETLALEGRAGYYDEAGALRDMVQNHLLQLLCLVAMERPATLGQRELRDCKVELLRQVSRPSAQEVAVNTIRARYDAGRVGQRTLAAYVDEPGVNPDRGTETFCEVTLFVDNDRWDGVPFRLRTGKALGADRRQMTVHFRPIPYLAFGQEGDPPLNRLTFRMGPDRLCLDVALNGSGDPFCLEPATLDLELAPQELSAYARLLLDVFEGDPSLSIRGDEAEECWRIVEPILAAWDNGAPPLLTYPAGSDGPSLA